MSIIHPVFAETAKTKKVGSMVGTLFFVNICKLRIIIFLSSTNQCSV